MHTITDRSNKRRLDAQVADKTAIHSNIRRGQIAGILSVTGSFSLAGYALYLGFSTVAGTICSVTVVGLVTIFVTGRKVDK